jgi:CheY-like chemotaxis protein
MGRRGDVSRIKELGFSAYLSKPVKQSQLYDCLVSVLGQGKLPREVPSKEVITRHSVAETRRRKIRILVAEDNPVNQIVAVKCLEKFGYRADAVANGLEAIRALETTTYDLVLMDVQMPEMDGFEATKKIRDPSSAVRNHAIPIVAMTANAMKGDRERCLEVGMDDYVSKPVKSAELAEKIEKRLSSSVPVAPKPAPRPSPADRKVFDKSVLIEILEGDEDLCAQILGLFLEETSGQLKSLKEALDREDPLSLERQAHSLKGASANVGACRFRDSAARLEEIGRGKRLEGARGLIEELEEEFERFRESVQEETSR